MVAEAGDPVPVVEEAPLVADSEIVLPERTTHESIHTNELTRLNDSFSRVESNVQELRKIVLSFGQRLSEAEQEAQTQKHTPTSVPVPEVAPAEKKPDKRSYNQKRRHK